MLLEGDGRSLRSIAKNLKQNLCSNSTYNFFLRRKEVIQDLLFSLETSQIDYQIIYVKAKYKDKRNKSGVLVKYRVAKSKIYLVIKGEKSRTFFKISYIDKFYKENNRYFLK